MSESHAPPPASNDRLRAPLALNVLAWLYIATGVGAVLGIAKAIAHNTIDLDFSVFCVLIGWGLLRRSASSRAWALFCSGLGAILIVPVAIILYYAKAPLTVSIFDRDLGSVPKIWAVGFGLLALLVLFWQYLILTRSDVRKLFRRQPSEPNGAARQQLVPSWFMAAMAILAVVQYCVARANNPHDDSRMDNVWHTVALDDSPRLCLEFDLCHNRAIVDDKTNAISIVANMGSSCSYMRRTDSRGRIAWINGGPPDGIEFPMVANTLSIQLPGESEREFRLPPGAARRFLGESHGPEPGHKNSLLQRALRQFGPSEQRSRLTELLVAYREPQEPSVLARFDDPEMMKFVKLTPGHAQAIQIAADKSHALEITTDAKALWPSVVIEPTGGKWDLSDFDAATVDIQNPEDSPVRVLMNVNNPGADGEHHCSTDATTVPAHGKATLSVALGSWYGDARPFDLANVVSVSVGLDRPGKSRRFLITRVLAVEADYRQIDAALADPFFQKLKPVFGRGINLGNALDAPKEGEWGVTLKEAYFEQIAAAGFDSVRIPVRWSAHAALAAPYAIDPKFFDRVDWAVRQALQRKLIPIVDMHHYEAMFDEPEKNRKRFLALWAQIAEHYKNFPPELALELLNEPHNKLTPDIWNSVLADGIAVVRRTNPTREIVVGPVGWNAIGELHGLVLPKDDQHLVVTVHYYSPFQFTHQGAEFVPGAEQWRGRKWTGTKAEQQAIARDFDTAIVWAVKNHRPLYLGEFGVYHKADEESRARWIRRVADEAVKRKMGFAYWEFCSGFGIYDPTTDRWIKPLKDALLGK